MKALLWAAAVVLLAAAMAAAKEPTKIERGRAGPYRFELWLYEPRALATRPVRFTVRVVDHEELREAVAVRVIGRPGVETPAVPTRPVRLLPSTEVPGAYDGSLLLSVLGIWDLEVTIGGPVGAGTAHVPIVVTAPWVIPEWVGWLAGLSPLLGLIWFIAWQRRYLTELRRGDPLSPVTHLPAGHLFRAGVDPHL